MFKSTKSFDKAIYDFLTKVNQGTPFKEIYDSSDKIELNDIINECNKRKFLLDIPRIYFLAKDKEPIIEETITFRLTYDGLTFIENFNT